ncbi:phospholipase D-like domain-containing protein [Phycisphaerales bacterium AB-hyl4]|uniref:Phospholipase D-like domain-containing protein n=1 Tax=Natronomicrosphaera hydrolytica TaxID=3242702 RepID=A0ABV4U1U6_9BACT
MIQELLFYASQLIASLHLPIAILASIHVVLHKEDERAAIGWAGLIWLSPLLGASLYWFFGVNRIRRRARTLREAQPEVHVATDEATATDAQRDVAFGEEPVNLRPLANLIGNITDRPLLQGNAIDPLSTGDMAYPAMIDAITTAQRSVALSSYIFDNDDAGKMFRTALADAVKRGVEVRVLIDDVGSRYTWPPVLRSLRRAGITTARFMPSLIPWKFAYANLRNHRKLLVIDGEIGFTGGMNIRVGNMLATNPRSPIHDLHFRLRGPVVAHLEETFAEDWAFATGEVLDGPAWTTTITPVGSGLARGIADGPDEDFDNLRMTLMGALAAARKRVVVVSPYFLPDDAVMTSLALAARRGVQVQVILPRTSNLRLVQWASMAIWPRIVANACELWLTPPPFDHSKLMLVDDRWTLLGSANWDARSLRLNFEFNVEYYDTGLAAQLNTIIDEKLRNAERVTAEQLASRRVIWKIRDGIARLASPYL